MSDSNPDPRFLEVDGVRLEVESGELTGPDGRTTRLAPQPTRLLALLAAEPGRVVGREAIAEHLWPHGSVEIDQGIGYAVREVRKALEAVGGDPAVIETIPRRGFRLRFEPDHATDWRTPPVAGAIGAVAIGAVLVAVVIGRPAADVPVLAIFEHEASFAPAGTGLTGALAATLTTRLTQNYPGRLGVVGPTGTTSLAGPNDVEGARERLGACLILSGGVRLSPDSEVVVFTQLVRTSDRVHVWASTDTVLRARTVEETVVPVILAAVERAIRGC
jgi:DNA-binding winged helix-turn-helix (wHTH) protein/TolB-like protein